MPDYISHIQQAEHNECVAGYLRRQGGQFNDWVVTALFYPAMHYVEAKIFKESIAGVRHSQDFQAVNRKAVRITSTHNKRRAIIQRHMKEIYHSYNTLFQKCLEVRYYCAFAQNQEGRNKPDVYIDETEIELLYQRFNLIKTHVAGSAAS